MAFLGTLPKRMATMMATHVDFASWGSVYVGCSGTFRGEQIVHAACPDLPVYGNDISAMTCATGYALLNKLLPFEFTGELEFLRKYQNTNPVDLVAAIGIALQYGSYKPKYEYGRRYRKEIIENLDQLMDFNRGKVQKFIESVHITDFFAEDFHGQIRRAKENGAGFVSFAPTYKGGYEKQYRFLDENSEWDRPSYEIWDPKNIHELIEQVKELNIPYCIITDHIVEQCPDEPTLMLCEGKRPVIAYAQCKSSLRKHFKHTTPFKYKLIQPEKINEHSQVQIYQVKSEHIAYLKSIYLAKGIDFVSGDMNFLVGIDGMIAGGFTYSKTKFGDPLSEIYLLSDFSLSRERKLSKLIAMTATSRDIVNMFNRRFITNIKEITTTAFTKKPVSMKYRGIFKIIKKNPDSINYSSEVRQMSPQEIFNEWFSKYGNK